jgi:hypothetical protein
MLLGPLGDEVPHISPVGPRSNVNRGRAPPHLFLPRPSVPSVLSPVRPVLLGRVDPLAVIGTELKLNEEEGHRHWFSS